MAGVLQAPKEEKFLAPQQFSASVLQESKAATTNAITAIIEKALGKEKVEALQNTQDPETADKMMTAYMDEIKKTDLAAFTKIRHCYSELDTKDQLERVYNEAFVLLTKDQAHSDHYKKLLVQTTHAVESKDCIAESRAVIIPSIAQLLANEIVPSERDYLNQYGRELFEIGMRAFVNTDEKGAKKLQDSINLNRYSLKLGIHNLIQSTKGKNVSVFFFEITDKKYKHFYKYCMLLFAGKIGAADKYYNETPEENKAGYKSTDGKHSRYFEDLTKIHNLAKEMGYFEITSTFPKGVGEFQALAEKAPTPPPGLELSKQRQLSHCPMR